MVNFKHGTLVTCDAAMKQFLKHLDDTLALGTRFVVADLDETHLFIDTDILPTLQAKIDALMESLAPDMTDTK